MRVSAIGFSKQKGARRGEHLYN